MMCPGIATAVYSSVMQMLCTLLGNGDAQIKRHGFYPQGDRSQKQALKAVQRSICKILSIQLECHLFDKNRHHPHAHWLFPSHVQV